MNFKANNDFNIIIHYIIENYETKIFHNLLVILFNNLQIQKHLKMN